ncbi:unnamed protein product [Sphagnum troendelagicum]
MQEADFSIPPLVSEIDLGFHVEKSIMVCAVSVLATWAGGIADTVNQDEEISPLPPGDLDGFRMLLAGRSIPFLLSISFNAMIG